MDTIQLTIKEILEYIILGIKNKRYQVAINLAGDLLDILNKQNDHIPDEKGKLV